MDAQTRLSGISSHFSAELLRKKREAEGRGRDVIDLGAGDPDLAAPPDVVRAAAEAVAKAEHQRYPPRHGSKNFLEAAARWYRRRYGVELDPETELTALSGCKEGLGHLAQALLGPGDLALIPDPGYPSYRGEVLLAGARVRTLPLAAQEGFLPDLAALPKELAYEAKLAYLNYPHNPTGAVADAGFFQKAADWATGHQVKIVHDAAYIELADAPHPSFLAAKGAKEAGVELVSFSKAYSLAGWRIGFAAGSATAIAALRRVRDQYQNGTFGAVQEAAALALDRAEEITESYRGAYRARRELFSEGLRAAGWTASAARGAIYVWARPPQGSSQAAFEKLADDCSVLGVPGPAFGPSGEGWLRFAMVAPEARLEEAAKRISRLKWPAHG